MNKTTGVFCGCIPLAISSFLATQKLAALCHYDKLLGSPIFKYDGVSFYWPWSWFSWYAKFKPYIPQLFNDTEWYFYLGFIGFLATAYFVKPEKVLDSHGSARWADEEEVKKAGFISAHGVVIGLNDSPTMKTITSFIRWLEVIKKNLEANAEVRFDKKINTHRDKLFNLRQALENQILQVEAIDSNNQEQVKALAQKLADVNKQLDNTPSYNAKKHNPLTVYPIVFIYKKLFKWYSSLDHNYLHEDSSAHMLVIAPTRSGKGVGLIIPTLLGEWTSSCLVNDIKSENWGVTSGWRKRMGQTTIKFEPTSTDGSTARWNPLDEIEIGTKKEVSQAQNIAGILADYEGKGKPDHWTANAAKLITAVILHLKYAHYADPESYPEEPNLDTVNSFLQSKTVKVQRYNQNGKPAVGEDGLDVFDEQNLGFMEAVKKLKDFHHVPNEGIKIRRWSKEEQQYIYELFTPKDLKDCYSNQESLRNYPNIHPIVFKTFTEIAEKPENEGGSIVSTASTALKEYVDPVLSYNTSVSDFCIDDVMNHEKPVSLYLVTPPSDLKRLSPIFRLFFELLGIKHTAKIGEYKDGQCQTIYKHKCLVLLDEFSALGNLQNYVSTLSFTAGYGLKSFIITQGVPQINAIYTKDNQILMNCHTQIYYAPNDNDTAKYAEAQIGNKTITTQSRAESNQLFGMDTITHSETARPLLTADEFKRLGDQEVIVPTGRLPILTDKVKYYENDYFKKRLVDAPIVSDLIRNNPYPERDAAIAAWKERKLAAYYKKSDFMYQENTPDETDTHQAKTFEYKSTNEPR